jgi:hypothetical protein
MVRRDPRLDAALAASRAERDSALSSIRSMTASIKRDHAAFKEAKRGRDEERARQARSGELGPRMQELQRRIDAGETSWDDVVSGRDPHPSAEATREDMRRNLDDLSEVLAQDPEVAEQAAETRALQERVDRESRTEGL